MSERIDWTRMRSRRLSRRTLLVASSRAGVGAAGLALVGCGDDDDDGQAVAQVAQQEQPAQQEAMQQQQQAEPQQQAVQQQQAEQQAQQAQQQEQAGTVEAIERDEAEEDVEAAAPEIDTEATLNVATSRYTAGLDGQRSGSQTNYIHSATAYDSAMSNHPETAALEPNLVAEVELVDPTNLIFHVTRGINFHNGTPYTAEDLAFNWERVSAAAEYHQGGETSDHPNGWATARMTFGTVNFASYGLVDDYTIRVETPAPDASLVASVTGGAVVQHSKAYVEANGDEHVDTVGTVGTGPFQLADHIPDVGIKYTRYEGYHKDRDALAGPRLAWAKDLNVEIRPEPLSQIAGIQAGEIDVAYNLPTDVAAPYDGDPNFKVLYGPSGNPTHNIMFNTHDAVDEVDGVPNPFLDIRVREAANLAVNREAIINGLLTGVEEPSYGTYKASIGFPRETLAARYHGYDPERAKQLLAEAGYPDGIDVDLHIVTDFQVIVPTMALIVQQDLEAVGIRTTIIEYLSSAYFAEVRTYSKPGMFYFFSNGKRRAGVRDRGRDQRRRLLHRLRLSRDRYSRALRRPAAGDGPIRAR